VRQRACLGLVLVLVLVLISGSSRRDGSHPWLSSRSPITGGGDIICAVGGPSRYHPSSDGGEQKGCRKGLGGEYGGRVMCDAAPRLTSTNKNGAVGCCVLGYYIEEGCHAMPCHAMDGWMDTRDDCGCRDCLVLENLGRNTDSFTNRSGGDDERPPAARHTPGHTAT
jgi:hypothetical protein